MTTKIVTNVERTGKEETPLAGIDADGNGVASIQAFVKRLNETRHTNFKAEEITNPNWWEALGFHGEDGYKEFEKLYVAQWRDHPEEFLPTISYRRMHKMTLVAEVHWLTAIPKEMSEIFQAWSDHHYAGIDLGLNIVESTGAKAKLPYQLYEEDNPKLPKLVREYNRSLPKPLDPRLAKQVVVPKLGYTIPNVTAGDGVVFADTVDDGMGILHGLAQEITALIRGEANPRQDILSRIPIRFSTDSIFRE